RFWQRAKIRFCTWLRRDFGLNWLTRTLLYLLDTARVLAIVRGAEPYKGCEGLPGGFLNVCLETIEECAARETGEETGVRVNAQDVVLIDVRSAPTRDVRGHVVDHGYAYYVPRALKRAVLANVEAGDDAESLRFASVSEVLTQEMAFDHKELLSKAVGL